LYSVCIHIQTHTHNKYIHIVYYSFCSSPVLPTDESVGDKGAGVSGQVQREASSSQAHPSNIPQDSSETPNAQPQPFGQSFDQKKGIKYSKELKNPVLDFLHVLYLSFTKTIKRKVLTVFVYVKIYDI
jgi:hypothetical protein